MQIQPCYTQHRVRCLQSLFLAAVYLTLGGSTVNPDQSGAHQLENHVEAFICKGVYQRHLEDSFDKSITLWCYSDKIFFFLNFIFF